MGKIPAFIKSARFAEVSIMLGFPVIGLFFAFDSPDQLFSPDVPIFLAAIFALFVAIYAFNGLAGIGEDKANNRLSALKGKNVSFLVTLAVSLLTSLFLFWLIRSELAAFAAVSFLMWSLYSFPRIGFKYRPVLGTLIHFITQIIHFLMGYTIISPVNRSSIAVSVYFALLFSAGHINHELIDSEADEKTDIKTGAVYFGVEIWEKVSFFMFLAAVLYISALSIMSEGLFPQIIPFSAAGFIHLAYKIKHRKTEAKQPKFLAERHFYRIVYFAAGILFFLLKILKTQTFI